MKEKLFKTLHLSNHQDLYIYDRSRKIAADTWIVKLNFRMTIHIDDTLFSGIPKLPADIDDIKQKLGDEVIYEVETERNFVDDSEKENVFKELFDSYLSTNSHYISKEIFPGKYVIKKFIER